MGSPGGARSARLGGRFGTFTLGIAGALLATAAGVGAGLGYGPIALGVFIVALALAVGVIDWRWSIAGLLAYLPFSGIATVLLYPNQEPAVLAKDLLFVIPAYVGFAVAFLPSRRIMFSGAPRIAIVLLAALVAVQVLNPALPNAITGAVGAKVWLFYVPLLFLGYHWVRDRADLERLLGLLVAAAVIPAMIGVVEAALVYAGLAETVYSWYGDAAASVTQDFASLQLGGTELRRIPSTFSFATQYYVFTSSMVAVSYAWWRGTSTGQRHAWLGTSIFVLMLVAAFLSGARGAFVFVPLLLGMIIGLQALAAALRPAGSTSSGKAGRASGRAIAATIAVSIAVLVAGSVLGARASGLFTESFEYGSQQLDAVFVTGFEEALDLTLVGLGTGVDTNAARYVIDQSELFAVVGTAWEESWWVKALLELGIVGLLVAVLLLGQIAVGAVRSHLAIADRRLRSVSAALAALILWAIFYNFKAQYIDFDPLNVYFWLLAGVLLKLPRLDSAAPR